MDARIIHVAGTNGKGSVCAYLQAILMAEGKKTGFFTSPHLVSVNERIRINNQQISDERFLEIFKAVSYTHLDVYKRQGYHKIVGETIFVRGKVEKGTTP